MNREGRSEILLVALVLSVGLHFGLMYYARPKVMTHVVNDAVRTAHREAMRVTKAETPPDPVRIDVVRDIDALKDAPVAEQVQEMPPAPAENGQVATAQAAVPESLAGISDIPKPAAETATLDVKPLSTVRSDIKVRLPPPTFGAPQAVGVAGAPETAPLVPAALQARPPAVPAPGSADGLFGPAKLLPEEKMTVEKKVEAEKFKPEAEVREKVDEKLVEREKAAVKDLLDVSEAEELRKFVNAAMVRSTAGGWTYFKVMLSPRHELQVIPKDVVLLIDASGSIGKDRIRSIRKAAKAILRSCTNSGDRFNLVAFRDKYTYAFRRWQDCSQTAFDGADLWLDNVAAHGRTDVFSTIRSVLTLPRDPTRPLIALVITDGDANSGVSETSEILSKFTALNDGLISVYMYGVKGSANRELIDVLTRGNRGESFIYDGWRWSAGSGIEGLGERFRDPVLSDLRVVFTAASRAEAYPRRLRNIYRGGTLEFVGRVPSDVREVAFSIKGLNGKESYEGFFRLPLANAAEDPAVAAAWDEERKIDLKLN